MTQEGEDFFTKGKISPSKLLHQLLLENKDSFHWINGDYIAI